MVPALAHPRPQHPAVTPQPCKMFAVGNLTAPDCTARGQPCEHRQEAARGTLDRLRIASIAAVSKYEPLRRFLADRRDGEWRATFAGVEEVLGFTLCNSARAYRPWWANDPSHAQALHGWLAAGWQAVDVDVGGEALMFVRQR